MRLIGGEVFLGRVSEDRNGHWPDLLERSGRGWMRYK
jgi:hypothetical protein